MKVICDKCDCEFEINKSDIKEVILKGITSFYFKCKSCNEIYITACYDEYVIKEQNRLKRLDQKILIEKDIKNKTELQRKANRLLNHLKTQSDRLKSTVSVELL